MSFDFIKTRVILAESKFKAKPGELFINGMFKLCRHSGANENKNYNAQHLYFVEKSKIHTGDWYLMSFGQNDWELMECRDQEEANRCNTHYSISPSCFKIKATNNPEIETREIPNITDSFIEIFIKECNAGNTIKEVRLELVPDHSNIPDDEDEIIGSWRAYVTYKLKIDENNCVSVKPVNENFKREEVITIIKAFHLDSVEGKYTKDMLRGCNEWIEKNLY